MNEDINVIRDIQIAHNSYHAKLEEQLVKLIEKIEDVKVTINSFKEEKIKNEYNSESKKNTNITRKNVNNKKKTT